jgi:hypothetical protein
MIFEHALRNVQLSPMTCNTRPKNKTRIIHVEYKHYENVYNKKKYRVSSFSLNKDLCSLRRYF